MDQQTFCLVWAGKMGIKSYIKAMCAEEAIAKVQAENLSSFGTIVDIIDCHAVD